MTREELKACLMAEAEQAIDKLLKEKPAARMMSLDEIERLTLESGAQFEASVLKELGHEESEAESAAEQLCERCGSRMQRRGMHRRRIVTEVGETMLERAYYVCPGCGASLFPPG